MILHYISSNGQTFDLRGDEIKTRSANLHQYSWRPQTVARQYGAYVKSFSRDPMEYTIILDIPGNLAERKATLNALHAAFDHDIFTQTPGRLVSGDYYIECYITFSNTYYSNPWTNNQITVFCPYPLWQKPHEYSFAAGIGSGTVNNPGASPADFILTLYGPVDHAYCYVTINNIDVGARAALGSGDVMTINSRDKTIYVLHNGEETNLFDARLRRDEGSIFDRLPPGQSSLSWLSSMAIDMEIIEERSEPYWT